MPGTATITNASKNSVSTIDFDDRIEFAEGGLQVGDHADPTATTHRYDTKEGDRTEYDFYYRNKFRVAGQNADIVLMYSPRQSHNSTTTVLAHQTPEASLHVGGLMRHVEASLEIRATTVDVISSSLNDFDVVSTTTFQKQTAHKKYADQYIYDKEGNIEKIIPGGDISNSRFIAVSHKNANIRAKGMNITVFGGTTEVISPPEPGAPTRVYHYNANFVMESPELSEEPSLTFKRDMTRAVDSTLLKDVPSDGTDLAAETEVYGFNTISTMKYKLLQASQANWNTFSGSSAGFKIISEVKQLASAFRIKVSNLPRYANNYIEAVLIADRLEHSLEEVETDISYLTGSTMRGDAYIYLKDAVDTISDYASRWKRLEKRITEDFYHNSLDALDKEIDSIIRPPGYDSAYIKEKEYEELKELAAYSDPTRGLEEEGGPQDKRIEIERAIFGYTNGTSKLELDTNIVNDPAIFTNPILREYLDHDTHPPAYKYPDDEETTTEKDESGNDDSDEED